MTGAWSRSLITSDPRGKHGKPVVFGTRVPIDLVLGKLAAGMSYEEIQTEYELSRKDILAVIAFAAETVAETEIRAVQ